MGLDLSLAMLREAAGVPAPVAARAEALPFPPRAFDAVVAGQCWRWFDGFAVAHECRRVLRPGGLLAIAHFDYLVDHDGAAADTEQLVLAFNPNWVVGASTGRYEKWRPHLEAAGFEALDSFWYDEDVTYSQLDTEVATMLSARHPEPPVIPHRGVYPAREITVFIEPASSASIASSHGATRVVTFSG